ncbi:hypothetical protein CMI37_03430 [Candidatus Pacearchaeota archaeon]|nr:hypothetical protein [Candidatus Pacearchaeota archaeon]
MAIAAFDFERAKLSGRVSLDTLDLETTILEIPSRFTADSANVGRVMFRARLTTGQTRGSAIVRIYNDAEDGQVVRAAAIAVSSSCVVPITGGITMPTIGGMRMTAELTAASAAVEIEALVDPSTGGVPASNPFTVTSSIPNNASVEFGPAPMDCTRLQIQIPTAMIGACEIIWLDSAGAAVTTTGVAAGSDPFISLIPAGGYHLSIAQNSGAAAQPIITWS